MRRPRRHDDEPPEEGEEADEEPSGPPRPRKGAHRPPPVRAWSPTSSAGRGSAEEGADDDPESEDGRTSWFHRPRRPVFFRARDSLYFEPLVALAILVLLLVSLYAYTSNWPPVYVVESQSMQHGSVDQVGLINTGDLVLAQRLPTDQIRTYVDGISSGYSTYGEFGDVLLYQPNGVPGTPVIHRALIYLVSNGDGTWNAPSLVGLPCGTAAGAVYRLSSTSSGCGTQHMVGDLTLLGVGWKSVNASVPLGILGSASGFVTMGDNNIAASPGGTGEVDQTFGISGLVQPSWVIGVARGMIPWFGSVKLLLEGNSAEVPVQSWEFLGITLVAIVGAAWLLHTFLRAEGIEDPRRKAEEEESEEDEEPEAEARAPRRSWHSPLRGWRSAEAEEEIGEGSEPSRERSSSRRFGGRPKPSVGRRAAKAKKGRHHEKDDDGL